MLEARKVSKTFKGKTNICVLDEIDFSLEEFQTTALMGASGSGKSTLARILLGIEKKDAGQILWNEKEVNWKNRKESLKFRRNVQYISQHPESFFDPFWTLGKSVREACRIHHISDAWYEKKIPELLEQVKINSAVLERYPYQVSGGEIQRVSLCRALLLEPKVLIMDEATSMLDVSVQAQILHLLKDIKKQHGLTYLFISHDETVVKWFSDKIFYLDGGKIKSW
ncbi:MAG: ATP-binding cassette domain-containing protein [Eubacteriales bacterium]|nr:ATP-binding cassette domain-containing protein [Eubacteriales bacterium]